MKKAIILIFVSTSLFAQINISRLSFDLGYVKNYKTVPNSIYFLSPEIKIGGQFNSDVLEWEVHSAYWDNGIEEDSEQDSHASEFSYSNFIFGGKLYFLPGKLKFHMLLNGGLSYRYVLQEEFNNYYPEFSGNDDSFHILSLDLGVGFRYHINKLFRLRTELNAYIALTGNYPDSYNFNTGGIKLGVDYFLK